MLVPPSWAPANMRKHPTDVCGQEHHNLLGYQHYAKTLHDTEIFWEEWKEIFLQNTCRSDSHPYTSCAAALSPGWQDDQLFSHGKPLVKVWVQFLRVGGRSRAGSVFKLDYNELGSSINDTASRGKAAFYFIGIMCTSMLLLLIWSWQLPQVCTFFNHKNQIGEFLKIKNTWARLK